MPLAALSAPQASIAAALVAFAIAAGVLTVTPGLDTALVLRTAAVEGPRRAITAGLGICTGCLVWGLLVALGLATLLEASATAYAVLRWAGAAYVLYLGLGMLLRPRSDFLERPEEIDAAAPAGRRGWYIRGLLTNLLNPKVGVFYVTFLPQFVPARVNVPLFIIALVAIHAVEGMIWFSVLITATRPLSRWLHRPRVVKGLDRLTGTVLVAFGVKLAVE